MALLVAMVLITAYALLLTVFHMKQSREVEELREDNYFADRKLTQYRSQIFDMYRKLERAKENAEADWISCKAAEKKLEAALKDSDREKERLMKINDKLMERLKKVTL